MKTKDEKLNYVTHTVRRNQIILQYGVGAMIDFPSQVLMTSMTEKWKNPKNIYDERLQKFLKVDKFISPSEKESVSFVRFPEWYFCPKCRRFQPLLQWVKEKNDAHQSKLNTYDKYMSRKLYCSKDYQELVPARIIVACENGHIDDFPWVKWVHKKNKTGEKPICNNPQLKFKTGSSASSGLEGVEIECTTCNCKATLKSAFNNDDENYNIFEHLSKEGIIDFSCTGRHPWKHESEICSLYPRTLQRGSSSVYFPKTVSSLVIPPFSDDINTKIEASHQFDYMINIKSFIEMGEIVDDKDIKLLELIKKYCVLISEEIGEDENAVNEILKRKFTSPGIESDINYQDMKYKEDEYKALTGKIKSFSSRYGEFTREEVNVALYNVPGLKSISLIHKIREVTALIGFSRINPVGEVSDQTMNLVSIKEPRTNYYPASSGKGEGIFIEFDQQMILNHLQKYNLLARGLKVGQKYGKSFLGKHSDKSVNSVFIFIHTLSHLLIKELSVNSGYSTASLRERIYHSDLNDKNMCGILIYTTSSDEEGTLGGLVRQGRTDVLPSIFRSSLSSAQYCANDPVCNFSDGQGLEGLNLAACHSCTLLPETSCEYNNSMLDRVVLIGELGHEEYGFFSDWLQYKE